MQVYSYEKLDTLVSAMWFQDRTSGEILGSWADRIRDWGHMRDEGGARVAASSRFPLCSSLGFCWACRSYLKCLHPAKSSSSCLPLGRLWAKQTCCLAYSLEGTRVRAVGQDANWSKSNSRLEICRIPKHRSTKRRGAVLCFTQKQSKY